MDALADLVDGFAPREDDDDAVLEADDLVVGRPVLRPPSFRDFYAFERHVGTIWRSRGQDIPEAWYRLPIFYFSNVSELRGPGEAVCAPRGKNGTLNSLQSLTTWTTCSVELGKTTTSGWFFSMV